MNILLSFDTVQPGILQIIINQCSWRIVKDEEIVVGYSDQYYPADEESDWESFDPEKDLS